MQHCYVGWLVIHWWCMTRKWNTLKSTIEEFSSTVYASVAAYNRCYTRCNIMFVYASVYNRLWFQKVPEFRKNILRDLLIWHRPLCEVAPTVHAKLIAGRYSNQQNIMIRTDILHHMYASVPETSHSGSIELIVSKCTVGLLPSARREGTCTSTVCGPCFANVSPICSLNLLAHFFFFLLFYY